MNLERILVPVDLTAKSFAALDYGLMLSKLYKTKLYIIHVIDNSPRIAFLDGDSDFSIEENVRIEVNRYIREMLRDYCEIIQVIKCGSPEQEILKFAYKEQIDLIVLSVGNDNKIPGRHKKSVAEKVKSISKIPITVVNQDPGRLSLPLIKIPESFNSALNINSGI